MAKIKFCATWIFLFLLQQSIWATLPSDGPCPTNVTVMPNFDMKKFEGTWNVYSRYPHLAEMVPKCITYNYGESNGQYTLDTREVLASSDAIREESLSITNVGKTGTFKRESKNNILKDPVNVWVFDTDYTNYATMLTCMDIMGVISFPWPAIITREVKPSADVVKKAEASIKKNGWQLNNMYHIKHENCPKPTAASRTGRKKKMRIYKKKNRIQARTAPKKEKKRKHKVNRL